MGGTRDSNLDSRTILARYTSAGLLDTSFGNGGKVIRKIGDSSVVNSVVVQNNNQILAAVKEKINSQYQFAVIRFNSDGSIDTKFGQQGIANSFFAFGNNVCMAIATEQNSEIIAAGYSYNGQDYDFALAKFDSMGKPALNFGLKGEVTASIGSAETDGPGIVVQQDGKIIVGGSSYNGGDVKFALARYNLAGSLDTAFGNKGESNTLIKDPYGYGLGIVCIGLQSDGKVLATGSSFEFNNFIALVRYNSNGTLDSTFSLFGIDTIQFLNGLAHPVELLIQSDKKILIVSNLYNDINSNPLILRFNPDGSPDQTFGSNGKIILSSDAFYVTTAALQSDDKIILAGSDGDDSLRMTRLNQNGVIDESFGANGSVSIIIGAYPNILSKILIQKDNKIVVIGSSDYALSMVRLQNNGSLDSSFGMDGINLTSFDGFETSGIIEADGKIITFNNSSILDSLGNFLRFGFQLERFNSNGLLDSTFAKNGSITTDVQGNNNSPLYTLVSDQDGKIIALGSFGNFYILARYIDDLTLGIINFSSRSNTALIYPNPIHQTATLKYTVSEEENITINLYDVSGKVLKTFVAGQNQAKGNYTEQLNFGSNIPPGNYFLVISNGRQKETVKLIKQ